MEPPSAENGLHHPHPPTWWQRVVLRRTVRCSCGWSGHTFDIHRPPHVMSRHGRIAMHSKTCWCREQRGPNDRAWVHEHHRECSECREATRIIPPGRQDA